MNYIPTNYTNQVEHVLSSQTQFQAINENVGTFNLSPKNLGEYRYGLELTAKTGESENQPKNEVNQNSTKIISGLRKLLDSFNIDNNSRTRNTIVSYQGILESYIEKLYTNPNSQNEIINLKEVLFQLLRDSNGSLSQTQMNNVYELLANLNRINNVQTNPRKENSDKESQKVEGATQEADVNFFDNVVVPNFFDFDTRTVKINTIRKFCHEDIQKCETYLAFLIRHRFEIEYNPNAKAKIKVFLDPLISYFQLAIQQQKQVYPKIN